MKRNRALTAVLIALALWMYRKNVLRLIKFIRNLPRWSEMLHKLPGPGREFEGYLLGHMTGPLMLPPGQSFDPEYNVEHMIENMQKVSKMSEGHGFFRRKFLCMTWCHTDTPLSQCTL